MFSAHFSVLKVCCVWQNFEISTQKLILHWQFSIFWVFSTAKNYNYSIRKHNFTMFRFFKKMCRFLVNFLKFFDSSHRFVLSWSQIRPNWTEKSSNDPVGDQNCLKNDCVKTVFFNSVFEIFVLKVCVLKQFQKMTVYVENVDFRKTHQA